MTKVATVTFSLHGFAKKCLKSTNIYVIISMFFSRISLRAIINPIQQVAIPFLFRTSCRARPLNHACPCAATRVPQICHTAHSVGTFETRDPLSAPPLRLSWRWGVLREAKVRPCCCHALSVPNMASQCTSPLCSIPVQDEECSPKARNKLIENKSAQTPTCPPELRKQCHYVFTSYVDLP